MGLICSCLLPKQGGGTSQFQVNPTQLSTPSITLYLSASLKMGVLSSVPPPPNCGRAPTLFESFLVGTFTAERYRKSLKGSFHLGQRRDGEPKYKLTGICANLLETMKSIARFQHNLVRGYPRICSTPIPIPIPNPPHRGGLRRPSQLAWRARFTWAFVRQ